METIEIEKEMIKTKKFLEKVPKLISELKFNLDGYNEEYLFIEMNELDDGSDGGGELCQLSNEISSLYELIQKLETINNYQH
jgi:hypothetical protein